MAFDFDPGYTGGKIIRRGHAAVEMKFEGGKELERLLDKLPIRIQKRVMKSATKAAANIVVKQARENLKTMGAVDSGLLSKSLTARVKVYKGGVVNAAIGPHKKQTGDYVYRSDWGEKVIWREPKKYAHLVELGTYRTRAKPFLRVALFAMMPRIVERFKQILGKRIAKEGQKLGRELGIPA